MSNEALNPHIQNSPESLESKNAETEELQNSFKKEWGEFCDNLEETLNMPEVTVHIFARFEDEFEKFWNEWEFKVESLLSQKNLPPEQKRALLDLQKSLKEIKESFLAYDSGFINTVRKIIQSPNATYPKHGRLNNQTKHKGLSLV